MKTNPNINYTPAKVRALRHAYTQAVKAGQEQFTFEGNEYVTGYAKYLLEYLATVFKEPT